MPRAVLIVALLLSVLGIAPASVPTVAQASAPAALAQCNVAPGSVVALTGTPHLFINDNVGVLLHWGGDTRALAGRTIQWSNTCNVSLPQLEATARGDPWLSAGLPQVGPVIYQAKWEQHEAEPTLLRIRTIDDVELFGIGDANYGTFVLQRSPWETQYGFPVGTLRVGPLASADSFAWSSTDQTNYAQLLTNMTGVESAALFQATQAGIDAGTSLPQIADCEEQGLTDWDRTRNASTALSATQNCLTRLAFGPVPSAPSAPTNLRLSATTVSNAIRLDWTDTSNNESGVRVIRNDQTIATLGANATTFTDTSVPVGVLVCYSVEAFNTGGQARSGSVCTGAAATVPSAPTNLRISPAAGTALRLDWIDISSNEAGFRIQRGGLVIGTVAANVTTFTDPTASPTTPNCYQVVAFNSVGESPSSTACSSAPTAPTGLRVSPGQGNGLRLDWVDTSNNEDGFRIVRSGLSIATVGENVTTFTDFGWNPVVQNCYVVVAFNTAGESSSAQACAGVSVQPLPVSVPETPPAD